MSNDRSAGRPSKFPKGGNMVKVVINRSLPEKGKEEIIKAIDKTINQFRDYDWT